MMIDKQENYDTRTKRNGDICCYEHLTFVLNLSLISVNFLPHMTSTETPNNYTEVLQLRVFTNSHAEGCSLCPCSLKV
jgi:hypothetical protein